jgi:hypothetical protein
MTEQKRTEIPDFEADYLIPAIRILHSAIPHIIRRIPVLQLEFFPRRYPVSDEKFFPQ